jgi:RNA 2',3'-cyclic 3'-phosphodiesterase
VDDARARAIGAALAAAVAAAKPFDVTLGGFGAFPDEERPRVVWIGVERHPALELLANDVERALAPLGFEAELRPFAPHLTIGRTRRDARPAALRGFGALAAQAAYEGVLRVESVDLMQSVLGGDGPTYHVLHRAPLGAKGG